MTEDVKLFLSCVSDEFWAYRDELRRKLTRPNVEIKIQEDFKLLGGDTLKMLEDYIAKCEAVIHFVGEMAGSTPAPASVDDLVMRNPALGSRLADKGIGREALASFTYTQWEAWLAVVFGKNLLIVQPAEGVARDAAFAPTEGSRTSQALHLTRLRAIDRWPGSPFANADALVAQILSSAVIDALVKAAAKPACQPRNLPFASLGTLFVGREGAISDLRVALTSAKGAAITGRALHGLGGIGKTRLAIEYAFAHATDYSALLFVSADSEAALPTGLAALAGSEVLDLNDEAREDEVKIEAVLRWLAAHPTWLLILDNVDDEQAVAAAIRLLPRLMGGHVIVTARASNFPASLPSLELDVLDEVPATQFLSDRTRGKRVQADNDEACARKIARELDGLALGLEQASAYIAKQRITFARYLKIWTENRERALVWSDATLTGSERTLATTWATSVERLTPESCRMLDRLAMLAPDPIPERLFDVPVPGEAPGYDAYDARANLAGYSLIAEARGDHGGVKGWAVHRLVQDFARRSMCDARRAEALREALEWVNAAWDGDVRSWPVLDPLAPHALAVAWRGDEAGIAKPTWRLFAAVGTSFYLKARFAEAEPIYRRALTIVENGLGTDDQTVATCLNLLGLLLNETGRHGEAEQYLRRALTISTARFGPDHSEVGGILVNLANALQGLHRTVEAETLYSQALAIFEEKKGRDGPETASILSNIADILRDANRLDEAESLYVRALKIDENSYEPHRANVSKRLTKFAHLLERTNRASEAEPLYRRALAIDEANLGPDDPNVAADLATLALLLKTMNRLDEAGLLCRRALAIYESKLGPDNPKVAVVLLLLAGLLKTTNRPDEAEPLYRRALAIDEASYGPAHPNVATDLNKLAELLQGTNRIAEAEPLYRRALAIDEASFGPDHSQVAIRLSNLSLLLRQANRTNEAEPLGRRALKINEASHGADHQKVGYSLWLLASIAMDDKNRLSEAESLYRRALAILEKSLGPDHANTAIVRKGLAALVA